MSDSGAAPRAGAEAARMLRSAQEWLRTSAPHLAPVDVDGSPCSCPLCRGVAKVRDADPDTFAVWVDSAVTALESLAEHAAAAARPAAPAPDAEAAEEDAPGEGAFDGDAAQAAEHEAGRRVRRIPLDRPDPESPL